MKKYVAILMTCFASALFSWNVGWTALSNTQLTTADPAQDAALNPNYPGAPPWQGICGQYSVISAWCGAIADTKRNRLIIWGGGHGDYYGNEVYSLNLADNPPAMTRLTNPSAFDFSGGYPYPETCLDGTPVSKHTYGGLVYLPVQDRMFSFGGANAPTNSGSDHTWTLDLSVTPPVWHAMDPVNGFNPVPRYGSVCGATAAYDPNSGDVFCFWGSTYVFMRYTFSTNTWTEISDYCVVKPGIQVGPAGMPVIDPKRKLLFIMGSGDPVRVEAFDISQGSNFAIQDWTPQITGDDSLTYSDFAGVAYDSVLDRIVGWPNHGNTVYLFDPDTKHFQAVTYPGGPPQTPGTSTTGTYGRFRYFPDLDAFAVVSGADCDAYILKLPANITKADRTPAIPRQAASLAVSYGFGRVNVRFAGMPLEKTVTICDVAGRVIFRKTHAGTAELNLNASDFAAGIYLLRAVGPGFTASAKFVIK